MELDEFGKLFGDFRSSAFRLETRDRYEVSEEASAFAAFKEGAYLPDDPNADWLPIVRNAIQRGGSMSRVHLIPEKPSTYLRFEIEWAYLYSAHEGEEIYLLSLGQLPNDIPADDLYDFWLFDDRIVIEMQYDDDGRFVQPVRRSDEELNRHLQLRQRLLEVAETLSQYLARIRTS